MVAGIDHQRIGISNELIPLKRRYVLAGRNMRLDVGTAERDDLFFQSHAHTTKRGLARVRPARLDRHLEPECILKPGKYSLQRVATAG